MPDEAPDTFNAANVAAKGKYAPTRTICGSSEKPYLLGQIPDDPIGDDDFSEEDKQVLQIVVTSNQTATSIKRQPMPNQPLRSIRSWIEISHPHIFPRSDRPSTPSLASNRRKPDFACRA